MQLIFLLCLIRAQLSSTETYDTVGLEKSRSVLEKKLDNFWLFFFSIFALVGKAVVLPKAMADANCSFREGEFANPISLNLEFFF